MKFIYSKSNETIQKLKKCFHKAKKEPKYRRRIFPRFVLCMAGMLLMLSSWGLGFVVQEKPEDSVDAFQQETFQLRSNGENDKLTHIEFDYQHSYSIGVRFPQLGIDALDEHIKKDIHGIVNQYKADYKKNSSLSGKKKAILSINYDIVEYQERFLSVVYSALSDLPNQNNEKDRVFVMHYDKEKEKPVENSEFFDEKILAVLSEEVRDYFSGDEEYQEYTSTKRFISNTKPIWENYQDISVSDDALKVYFDPVRLFRKTGPAICIEIPMSKVENLLLFSPARMIERKPLTAVDPNKPMVALTFDDGPHPKITDRILNQLEKHDARATFFIVGNRVNKYPKQMRRAVSLNCQIGNHSYNHKNLVKLKEQDVKKQISQTNELISGVIGGDAFFVRPPYGAHNGTVDKAVGAPVVMWSVDTLDWKSKDAKKVFEHVKKNVKDGDIVLMHDLYTSTADAADKIIPYLSDKGYQLVTVEEIILARREEAVPGKTYYNVRK